MTNTCKEIDRHLPERMNIEFKNVARQNYENFYTSQKMENNVFKDSDRNSLSWYINPQHDPAYAGTWKVQIGNP